MVGELADLTQTPQQRYGTLTELDRGNLATIIQLITRTSLATRMTFWYVEVLFHLTFASTPCVVVIAELALLMTFSGPLPHFLQLWPLKYILSTHFSTSVPRTLW